MKIFIKLFTILTGLAGLLVAILVIAHQNLDMVSHVLAQAGLGLLWLVPFHALPLLIDATAWRILLAPRDPQARAGVGYLWWIATVREAANRLLPLANVGGELIGIRLVLLRKLDGAAVTASVVIEVLLTFLNQYLFVALGLVLLLMLKQSTPMAGALLIGVVLSLPIPILFGVLLRYGAVFERMGMLVERFLGDSSKLSALLGGSSLDAEIKALYARRGRLLAALLCQLAGYIVGSFETWLALVLLGHPVTIWAALAVEALTQAVRQLIFFVPAGIGVQEAGLVLFGQMVGISNEVAVALSLVKRMREVLFGVPALLSWQWAEGNLLHRALRRQTNAAASTQDRSL